MENIELYSSIIALGISTIIGFIKSRSNGKQYNTAKAKISSIRDFTITLDEALKDDKVTEEEYKKIFQEFKEIVN